jgi:hypothetical protein
VSIEACEKQAAATYWFQVCISGENPNSVTAAVCIPVFSMHCKKCTCFKNTESYCHLVDQLTDQMIVFLGSILELLHFPKP